MARNRDEELDDLEKELKKAPAPERPFVARPDKLDIGSGSLCWRDGSRLCGADCVAFNAEEGLSPDGIALDTPNKCYVLKYMGQQGSAALSTLKVTKKAAQDAARAPMPSVPPTTGKKP